MIGPSASSSSLILRLASGIIRERFPVAATATSIFSLPNFHGILRNYYERQNEYRQQLFPLLSPCGATAVMPLPETQEQNHIWFAVPKSKISRSRKRMKNTRQKRIPLKKNIVFDPRTGEVTLKHKLPYNWKDYLPKVD